MSKWIDAITNPPEAGRNVIVKMGDGSVSAGYINVACGKHTAHNIEWDVYDCLQEPNVFGVVEWQPFPGEE